MRGVPLREVDALPSLRRALLSLGKSGCDDGTISGEALSASSDSKSSRNRLRGAIAVGMAIEVAEAANSEKKREVE